MQNILYSAFSNHRSEPRHTLLTQKEMYIFLIFNATFFLTFLSIYNIIFQSRPIYLNENMVNIIILLFAEIKLININIHTILNIPKSLSITITISKGCQSLSGRHIVSYGDEYLAPSYLIVVCHFSIKLYASLIITISPHTHLQRNQIDANI